ncbi:MAG: SpoIID/LytB domain-containing protein [Candidatus Caldatribacteriota bacterium]|nr:SpoIID/LytB domain-containing protein [Candidatus Caldatribacteriota bacterium]
MIKLNIGKVNNFFLFLGISMFFIFTFASNTLTAGKAPSLRVGIFLNQNELNISGDGSFEIYNLKSNKLISKENSKIVKMVSHAKGIKILEKGVYSGPVKVIPVGTTQIMVIVNGQKYRYRGNIEVIYDSVCKKLNVINVIGIEEYLYGVLKKEVSPKWPGETLKAQAIAARTFAIFNMNKYIEKGYNLDASTNSQAYGGVNHEDPLTSKAVNATKGKIIVYNGKAINAVYHSDSGGYTANSEDVWGSYLPYLRGVKSTFEDLVSPTHHRWDYTISERDLVQKLHKKGYDMNSIVDLELVKDEKTGRVNKLGFVSNNNRTDYMEAKEFRNLIGFEVIRSTLFNFEAVREKSVQKTEQTVEEINKNSEQDQSVIELLEQKKDWTIKELLDLMKERKKEKEKEKIENNKQTIYTQLPLIFKISGMGNGHGVGMSQWGAYGMAMQGSSHQDILNHYYQGIDIVKKY